MSTPNQAAYAAVQARRTLPHGQRPTDLHVRVMFVLARWQHPCPPHAKLARAAHCHRNSVGNALHRLRDLGLLTWEAQYKRAHGWRLRIANVYRFSRCPNIGGQTKTTGLYPSASGVDVPPASKDGSRGRPLLPIRTVAEQLRLLAVP